MFTFMQPVSEDITKDKYFLHGEKSVEEMFEGVATVASSLEKNKDLWKEIFYSEMIEGRLTPAGRILANARPNSPMRNYHNCFVIPIFDSMEDIYTALLEDSLIGKAGGGVGFNVSKLRPKGAKISKGGESSGVMSFLEVFNASAKAIHTGGNRRSAHITILNIDHPDIEEFITYKRGDENGRLTQFNISVGITDKFIEAVKADADWDLVFDGKVYKTVKAKYLYNLITDNMFLYNEPGILYLDEVARNNNGWYKYDIDATNPCVTGDTLILTDRGNVPIESVVGQKVNIWNGFEYSEVEPRITGYDQEIYDIEFSNGSKLSCTPYHKFVLEDSNRVEARDLKIGEYLHYWYSTSKKDIYIGVKVISIEKRKEREATVYCVTEPKNHTVIFGGVMTSNCGEQPLPPYSSCCLSAINLSSLVKKPFTDEAEFDFDTFETSVAIGVRFLDDILDVSEYPIEKIKEMVLSERRIGLGYTGMGDMLAKMKIAYGSPESMELNEKIAILFRDSSYLASIQLAKEKGPFPTYDEKILESGFIQRLPEHIKEEIRKYGLRNVALNTIAPNGTISLSIGNNCSSGIEPIFALEYTRNVRQPDDTFIPQKVYNKAWLEYIQFLGETPKEIPYFFKTADEISLDESVQMQALWQKYIDASISKTITLPDDCTIDEYRNLFMKTYEAKLKGYTTYNPKGYLKPILTKEEKKDETVTEETRYAKKRPEVLPCDIYEMMVNKKRMVVLVGLMNDKPYEVFLTEDPDNTINVLKEKQGTIQKVKISKELSRYDLHITGKKGDLVLQNITQVFDDDYAIMCRLASLYLRHENPLQFLVEQLNRTRGFDTFSKTLYRVLKKYLNGEAVLSSQGTCPDCGGNLQYIEGCVTCQSCGYSKC